MRISIGGQTQDAMKILGIEVYPFSPEELSTRFRHLIKVHHPDKNKDDCTAKETAQKLIRAYQHLKNLAITTLIDQEQEQEARKIFDEDEDLFTIWDTCPECKGSGKVKNRWGVGNTELCPDCDPMEQSFFSMLFRHSIGRSSGVKTLRCKYCKDGKFTQRNGRIVDCRVCKGTGIWKKVRCRTCNGFGIVNKKLERFVACSKCEGLGKVKLNPFNPVIRKGSILI